MYTTYEERVKERKKKMNRKSVLYLADTKEEKTKEMTKWCNGTNLLISGSVLVVSKSPTELFSSRFTF